MSGAPVQLRGIAWDHSRGFTPMAATAQRYGELHAGVDIAWQKRSLQAFADAPIEALAESFDLLVIDHPFAGFAARHDVLLDLNRHVPAAELTELAAGSVGASHASYDFDGRRCALAIDAATPVAGWREEGLARHHVLPPKTWEELLELARHGLVAVAGIPVDCLMSFFMFCHAQGEEPGVARERLVSAETGLAALALQLELMRLLPEETWTRNPIRVWDHLARADSRAAYCPFAYSYSNYARPGYAAHVLKFGRPPFHRGRPLRPTLGGTGIAISSRCRHPDVALDYARWIAGAACQRTLYFENGGQPAHLAAWRDAEANRRANDFFHDTLPAMEDSWVRPRYAGYLQFQDHGGTIVRDFLLGRHDARTALSALESAYRTSQPPG